MIHHSYTAHHSTHHSLYHIIHALGHDSWLTLIWDMTHPYMGHDSLRIHVRDMTHDSSIHGTWPMTLYKFTCRTWFIIHIQHITHYRMAKTHRMPYKLQVIFRKRATNYRALLQKMTYKDKASYGSSPPCTRAWRVTHSHVQPCIDESWVMSRSTHSHMTHYEFIPHQKFLGDGVLTTVPLFCLICTIIANKTGIFD